ncbi:MAG: hypothetical protein PWQ60_1195 [Thermoanaerobacteraceae bacterium]|jgi:hypothetical protein|nr:hypothetical protein [Thermoanaerobacteraceae bacterium]
MIVCPEYYRDKDPNLMVSIRIMNHPIYTIGTKLIQFAISKVLIGAEINIVLILLIYAFRSVVKRIFMFVKKVKHQ